MIAITSNARSSSLGVPDTKPSGRKKTIEVSNHSSRGTPNKTFLMTILVRHGEPLPCFTTCGLHPMPTMIGRTHQMRERYLKSISDFVGIEFQLESGLHDSNDGRHDERSDRGVGGQDAQHFDESCCQSHFFPGLAQSSSCHVRITRINTTAGKSHLTGMRRHAGCSFSKQYRRFRTQHDRHQYGRLRQCSVADDWFSTDFGGPCRRMSESGTQRFHRHMRRRYIRQADIHSSDRNRARIKGGRRYGVDGLDGRRRPRHDRHDQNDVIEWITDSKKKFLDNSRINNKSRLEGRLFLRATKSCCSCYCAAAAAEAAFAARLGSFSLIRADRPLRSRR